MDKNKLIQIIIGGLLLLFVFFLLTTKITITMLDTVEKKEPSKQSDKMIFLVNNDSSSYNVTPENLKEYNDSAYICNETVCCRDGYCFHLNGIVNDTNMPAFYN